MLEEAIREGLILLPVPTEMDVFLLEDRELWEEI